SFSGNGAGLIALDASNLTTGTVVDARLSGNIPRKNSASNSFTGALAAASLTGNGAGLSTLNATNLTSGTLNDARLSSNIPRRDFATNTFAGRVRAKSFSGPSGGAPSFPTVGTATVLAGKSSVHVVASTISLTSQVLVTLQSDPGANVAV